MTENENLLQIRDMTLKDIDGVVEVHRHCFPASISIFSVLNRNIVKRYYELFVKEPESLGAVLVEPGTERVGGFTAGTLKPGIQKRFAVRYCLPLCWNVLLGCLKSAAIRKVVFDHLKGIPKMFTEKRGKRFAEAEGSPPDGPIGFFMPIAIHPDFRGGGNAVKLADYLTKQFFERGVARIRGGGITIENIASRRLFEQKLGWNSKVISDKWVAVWIDRQDEALLPAPEKTNVVDKLSLRDMTLSDIDDVVELHRCCFPASVSIFSVLDHEIVRCYYAQFVKEPESFGVVLVEPGSEHVVGFVAGTTKIGFHSRFMQRYFFQFCWSIFKYFFISTTIRKAVWKRLRKVNRPFSRRHNRVLAETGYPPYIRKHEGLFMPIAVHKKWRVGGNAIRLAGHFTAQMFKAGITRIYGKVVPDNMASLKLFRKLGWSENKVSEEWISVWIDQTDLQSHS